MNWVVYVKPLFGGAEHVLDHLARYAPRVAISNHRLISFKGARVSFRWKGYAAGCKQKIMTVSADEFLRRFLIHVLPKGLVRIRHFGLFANCKRSAELLRCRFMLSAAAPPPQPVPTAQIKCPLGSELSSSSNELLASAYVYADHFTVQTSSRSLLTSHDRHRHQPGRPSPFQGTQRVVSLRGLLVGFTSAGPT